MRQFIALILATRVRVVVLAAIFLLAGSIIASRAPLDVLPDFAPVQVVVQTEARGLDPELVERLVTRPVENALSGAPGMEILRSESISGLSVVTMSFTDDSDPHQVRQGVAERIADVIPLLPAGVAAPRLSPLTSATMDVLKIGLLSSKVSAMELRHYADTVLRPALLAVPGVARLNVFGGQQPQIDIAIDPQRLLATGLTLDAVSAAASKALTLSGAGFVETDSQRFSVKLPNIVDEHDIAQIPLIQQGPRTVRIADVARVTTDVLPPFGDALVQGRNGVLLTLSSQFGANTLDVTRALEHRLAQFAPAFKQRGIELYPALHRPASFLITSLSNLRNALLLGLLFVSMVLIAFLRSWRASLVSFVAIPLSLLAATLVLWLAGFTINTMTLGGFAVALGVLVDDAVIDVENVMRRLRGRTLTLGERLSVILDASLEIRSPMIYATLVVLLVFVPVILLPGVEGRMAAPLSWAFVLSVLASLLVALTITPALAALLLKEETAHEPAWIEWLRRRQIGAVEAVARAPAVAVAVLGICLVAVAALAARIPAEFVPAFREGHLVAQVTLQQPGLSLASMKSVGLEMSRRLLALPFVATVEEQMGRAEQGEDTWPVDRGEFHIELKPDPALDQDWAQEQVRKVMEGFPGVSTEVLTFLGDRISETLTGETSQIVIGVYGDDLDALDNASERIAQAVTGIPGVTDLVAQGEARVPELQVVPKRDGLTAYAVDVSALRPVLDAATQGIAVGTVQSGELPIPVVVRMLHGPGDVRAAVAQQLVATPADGYVPFSSLAELRNTAARATIRHESGRRYSTVGFNVSGRSFADVTADARAKIDALRLPASVEVLFSGVGEAAQSSHRQLLAMSAGILLVIVLVLLMAFRRVRHALLVLMNLPFALIGALGALLLLGLPLSLGAAVGLVTVFGISARNAILLLAHLEQLQLEHPDSSPRARAYRAAEERLVPVLMTALVAGLGLLPLAFGLGRAGHEIEAPLAIAVLGGLVTSTLLSLILIPAITARERPPTAAA